MSETLPDFDAWFTAQFGKRPCTKSDELVLLVERQRGLNAGNKLYDAARYDAQRTVALYAWQAREKKGGAE